jgi:hypothetical protein
MATWSPPPACMAPRRCGELAAPSGLQLVGNGDVFSWTDWNAVRRPPYVSFLFYDTVESMIP